MSTIKDVAKRAGVAISTVSNVINNKGNVAPATVQKVNDAIKELDYKTNYVSKVIKNRQPKRIGMIVDDLCGLFYPYVIKPIRQIAEEQGYELVLYDTNSNSEKEWGIFESLICSQIDGIIFSTSTPPPEIPYFVNHLFELIRSSHRQICLVSIERDLSSYGIDSVYTNMRSVGQKATQHLLDMGCRVIGHITGPIEAEIVQDRMNGYKDALTKAEISIREHLIAYGDYSHVSGYKAMNDLLNWNPDIDGVFAANDQMAIGACMALKQANKRIPKDVKVIGCDDVFIDTIVEPPLSTVHIRKNLLGQEAMTALLEQLESRRIGSIKRLELENHLVIRQSTDKSSRSDYIPAEW